MSSSETLRQVYSNRPHPLVSYGLPFPAAASHSAAATFHASRAYIICSGSIARNTHSLEQLVSALEMDKVHVVGKRIGMTRHTLWSEVVEVVHDARRVDADLLLTLGAGSLTDAAKVVALVCSILYDTF